MPLYTGKNTQNCISYITYCVSSSMVHLLTCGDPDELEELSFTVSSSHFGALQTIELEDGGTMKRVTMDNKDSFVHKLCQWYLTGNVPIHCTLNVQHTYTRVHTHWFLQDIHTVNTKCRLHKSSTTKHQGGIPSVNTTPCYSMFQC